MVEPIPQTVEALRELTRHGDDSIARTLLMLSRDVERVTPDVVGLSLSLMADELTFTLTATNGPVAELDAVQYLSGGPCDDAIHTGERHVFRSDVTDEDRWRLFAQATAAEGVESTLSLPILRHGSVVAGVNLYGATPDAFEGHHEELATACGAWVGGAVTNADLSFSTRFQAAETPDRLHEQALVNQAIGALVSHWAIPVEEAERRLADSARRAGISDAQVARVILRLLVASTGDGPPSGQQEEADGRGERR